jgi:hypothetical protein
MVRTIKCEVLFAVLMEKRTTVRSVVEVVAKELLRTGVKLYAENQINGENMQQASW